MTEHFHRPNVAAEATQNDPQPLISNQQNKRPQDSTPKYKHNKLITNKIQNKKGRKNDLPQLASASCGKSFQRVMVTRYKELW